MPTYRLAHLSPEQMTAIESLENEIGLTLVAYEPMCDAVRDGAKARLDEDTSVLDGLVDTYRTEDPEIF